MSWTAPRTWVANEKVSASLMNTHWRDQLSVIATAGITGWEAYTPEWTADSAPAIGNGTLAGTYCQIGKSVFGEARMTCGSTTTYGSTTYQWTLPVTMDTAKRSGGGAICADSSPANDYVALLDWNGTPTTTKFYLLHGAATVNIVGNTGPFTWASGDSMRAFFAYEAA